METVLFELDWEGASGPTALSAERSRGKLTCYLRGQPVWGGRAPKARGISWTWIELLEHLARVWPWLELEQDYPCGFAADWPSHLHAVASQQLAQMPEPSRSAAELTLYNFAERHDLSHGLQGIQLPELWFLRQGNVVQVSTLKRGLELEYPEGLSALQSLATTIADRIARSPDERGKRAVAAWNRRGEVTHERAVRIYTGLPAEYLKELARGRPTWKQWETVSSEAFEPTELMAAARSTRGAVRPGLLRELLERVRRRKATDSSFREELSEVAQEALSDCGELSPAEQGYSAARAVRDHVGNVKDPLDPKALLAQMDVAVESFNLEAPQIDAIAVWGPRHGPVIYLNEAGRHAKGPEGKNATLAHELCHLLVDREGALPLAEALDSRLSLPFEARAKAFAAELLAPRSVVSEAFASSEEPSEVLEQLRKKFRASRELIAWQANNSDEPLSPAAASFLRGQVSRPDQF